MFEAIVSRIIKTVRGIVRVGATTHNAPWLTAAAILGLLLVVTNRPG